MTASSRATLAAYKRCALGYVALAFVASLALTHYRLASWKAAGDGRHALSRQLVDVLCWSARAGAFAVAYLSALWFLAFFYANFIFRSFVARRAHDRDRQSGV